MMLIRLLIQLLYSWFLNTLLLLSFYYLLPWNCAPFIIVFLVLFKTYSLERFLAWLLSITIWDASVWRRLVSYLCHLHRALLLVVDCMRRSLLFGLGTFRDLRDLRLNLKWKRRLQRHCFWSSLLDFNIQKVIIKMNWVFLLLVTLGHCWYLKRWHSSWRFIFKCYLLVPYHGVFSSAHWFPLPLLLLILISISLLLILLRSLVDFPAFHNLFWRVSHISTALHRLRSYLKWKFLVVAATWQYFGVQLSQRLLPLWSSERLVSETLSLACLQTDLIASQLNHLKWVIQLVEVVLRGLRPWITIMLLTSMLVHLLLWK